MASRIPPEVVHLLNNPEGRFVVVKGKAGTGKTMFCLELIRECGGLYISTRVRPDRLYADCPGLEESVPPDFIIDAATDLDETVLKDFMAKPHQPNGLPPPPPPNNAHNPKKSAAGFMADLAMPPLFRKILDKIEVAQIPFVVVIDSWDAVFSYTDASRNDMKRGWSREELRALLFNAFRNRNVNLVLVGEGGQNGELDYLVDGVIEMDRDRYNGRILRVMHLSKTRGTEAVRPDYLFTLHDGRFQYFDPFVPKIPARPKRWKPMEDTEARFSSGSEDLDRLLGGGFRKGTTVLLELGETVPDEALEQFVTQVSANFLAQQRAILMVPPGGMDIESIAQRGIRDVGEETFNANVRLIEKGGGPVPRDKPYIVSLKFESPRQDFNDWLYIYKALRQKTGLPVLEIVGIDTQEARYGEEAYKELLSVSSELTRKEGNLTLRITRPGMEGLTRRCANVSDVHIKMVELSGAVLVYLEKPRSGLFYMDTDASGGNIRITLSPLV
jgi:KaiC/GvpD/RAD55 family RecA-like ATPase